ncbi:MAG: class I SAM-dependent methyltransferase [Candidatus Cloacimonetes bacterium]|nr:class I SAM-dependent methyltransferase [Candidatus Cloacimonadota bacterium]
MENTIGNKLYNDVLKNHKRELEEFDKQKREIHRLWNIDAETAKYLFEYIVDLAPKKIIEIGTSNGYSGFWISAAAKVSNGILETIEVDEERFKLSQNNLKNQTNIIQYLGLAEDIIPTLENKYDIAFIDAGKIGYINYIKLLLPKLKDNAIIIADNVISHKKSVQEYIDFMKSDNQFENELIEIGTGLLISKFKRNRV